MPSQSISNVVCGTCRATFQRRRQRDQFCSIACANRRNSSTATCQHCGSSFWPKWGKSNQFCTRECKELARAARLARICIVCGSTYVRCKSQAGKYCSHECARVGTTRPPEERFELRVGRTSSALGCWCWTGAQGSKGYGTFNLTATDIVYAHRFAWELASGEPIPDGLDIGHTCDTPLCTRNDERGTYDVDGVALPRFGHLFCGTRAQNFRDMWLKKRARPRGSDYRAMSSEEIDAMCQLYMSGQHTQQALAARFNVSRTYVGIRVRAYSETRHPL